MKWLFLRKEIEDGWWIQSKDAAIQSFKVIIKKCCALNGSDIKEAIFSSHMSWRRATRRCQTSFKDLEEIPCILTTGTIIETGINCIVFVYDPTGFRITNRVLSNLASNTIFWPGIGGRVRMNKVKCCIATVNSCMKYLLTCSKPGRNISWSAGKHVFKIWLRAAVSWVNEVVDGLELPSIETNLSAKVCLILGIDTWL